MNPQPLLLVHGGAEACPKLAHLRALLLPSGLAIASTTAKLSPDVLKASVRAGTQPFVILIDAEPGNAAALSRQLRALSPASYLIFVCDEDKLAPLRAAMQRNPTIGSQWGIAAVDDPALVRMVVEAVKSSRRRQQLRTTLDRANAQLQAPRPSDSVEYRRMAMSERYLESFLAQSSDAIVALDHQAVILNANARAAELFDTPVAQLLGRQASALPFWAPERTESLARVAAGEKMQSTELDCVLGSATMALELVLSRVSAEDGAFLGTTLVIRDISVRRRQAAAERQAQALRTRAMARERERLMHMFDQAPGFMAIMEGDACTITLANPAFHRLFSGRALLNKPLRLALPDLSGQGFIDRAEEVYRSAQPYVAHAMPVLVRRDVERTEQLFVDLVYQPVFDEDGRVTAIFCQGNDVTERRLVQHQLMAHQAELEALVNERTAALRSAEVALHQSQKLEAIGKLTGGVAHDFNNILQVIAGNLEMLQTEAQGNPLTMGRLQKAVASVERGAKLSSQLLSFARRQPLQPVATHLGRIVRDMDDLLRRALGESIDIESIVGGGLWIAMVDRNQLENVILNMAINARDAMASVGKLTIELGNAMLDDAYAQTLADVPAGQYVMLAVSDTGSGMTPDIMDRVFEPFFTTKGEGEGTGLGLSMVYGFVKQSGGHIRIYSEPGHGTTFKIYLPRVHAAEAVIDDVRRAPAVGGTETILVVEDDLSLQSTVVEMLTGLGYRTFQANDGESALVILGSAAHIDLLFTDVVMPGPVRSPDLALRAKQLQPQIEVLFTSGYTQNAIVHGGRLDPGVELISKPYRRDDLARKIGHILANRRHLASLQRAHQHPGPALANAAPVSSRRILVVEDNPDTLDMLCELLRMLGHDAEGAASGEEASVRLSAQHFDTLLTDIGLPGLSGLALATQAKSRQPELRIIFASGYGAPQGLAFESVALPKPFDLTQLQQALEQSL